MGEREELAERMAHVYRVMQAAGASNGRTMHVWTKDLAVVAEVLEYMRAPAQRGAQSPYTCYLERSAVRSLLIGGTSDENVHITEGLLMEVDELPVFTAEDIAALRATEADAEAGGRPASTEFIEAIRRVGMPDPIREPEAADAGAVEAWLYEYNDIHDYWRGAVILNRPAKNPPTSHDGKTVRNVQPLYASPTDAGMRATIIEECAKAVEAETVGQDGTPISDATDISYDFAIEHAAAAVRALAHPSTNGNTGGPQS